MRDIKPNNYIKDILSQPAALQRAAKRYPAAEITKIKALIAEKKIQSIVMTGLGASFSSMYPAYLLFAILDLPVTHLNTAELMYYGAHLIAPDSLLWITSQSGESAETVRLLEKVKQNRPCCVVGLTNHAESALGREADICVDIFAGEEYSVATKTYLNSTVYGVLIASQLTTKGGCGLVEDVLKAGWLLSEYLENWQEIFKRIEHLVRGYKEIFIVGRGASMAAVWDGALVQKEAASVGAEGINAAEFRHGPLEMVEETATVIVLKGAEATAHLNRSLAIDVMDQGGRAIWIAEERSDQVPTVCIPEVAEWIRPLVEIVPLQLLSVVLARLKGNVPGEFVHINKTVRKE